jgi:thioredoxin-related protein
MPEERTGKIAKKIEVAANIAILVTACLVAVFFVKNYRAARTEQHHTIVVGTRFALKNINWGASRKNIVLALSTSCHYCTESAGFYRELAKECKAHNVRTFAVLPQTVSEAQLYLGNEGVNVDEILQASLPSLEITGTPTLLLIGKEGKVEHVWYGKLPSEDEKDVLTKL